MRESRVRYPICNGVVVERSVCYKAALIEVQTFDDGQRVGRSCEVEPYDIGVRTFALEQVLVLAFLKERIEHQVIRKVMDVWNDTNGVVVRRIAPNGIHAHIPFTSSCEGIGQKGNTFAFLRKEEVAILIFESESTILARLYALDAELARTICARDTSERLMPHNGVVEERVYRIKTDENAFYRLQVRCIEHSSRHFHCVNLFARTEAVSVVSHRIAFVVVDDSVAKIDGIGRACLQTVIKCHLHALAVSADVGRLNLRRRNNDLLVSILELDVFVEANLYLALSVVRCTIRRIARHDLRRYLVVNAAVGCAYACASRNEQQRKACKYVPRLHLPYLSILSASTCSMMSRLLQSRGTLCCPPSLPFCLSQSLNTPGRALMSSSL